MTIRRAPLFCDTALAERIERAKAQLISACSRASHRRRGAATGFVPPIADGVASFAENDSPFNKVVGMGFGGTPSATELDDVERAFAECGAPVQIELAHLADQEIGMLATERGYRLVSFETCSAVFPTAITSRSPRPGSRSGSAATTSSSPGSTSS